MSEFMFIIRGGQIPDRSPEYMQAHMEEWGKWMGGLAEQGKLVGGEPLNDAAKSVIESGTKVVDRPLAEGKELVGGYIIVKAESLDEATDLANGCPGFEHACTIEVREIQKMEQ